MDDSENDVYIREYEDGIVMMYGDLANGEEWLAIRKESLYLDGFAP